MSSNEDKKEVKVSEMLRIIQGVYPHIIESWIKC